MAIRIQTEKPVIPIELNPFTFEFEITDDNIKRLYDSMDQFEKEVANNKEESLEGAQDALRKAFDFLLGDGAFDKVYEEYPSTVMVANYFVQIAEGIEGEILNRAGNNNKSKQERYLQNKKRKNNNKRR